jgi:hypothetical protein
MSPVKMHPGRQNAQRSRAREHDTSRSAAEKASSFSLLATTAGQRKEGSLSTAEPTAPTRNTHPTVAATPTPLPAATTGQRMLSICHEKTGRTRPHSSPNIIQKNGKPTRHSLLRQEEPKHGEKNPQGSMDLGA